MDNTYKTIARWGKYMGSKQYYIDAQIALAVKDNAPQTAIYKKDDGEWSIAENIAAVPLRGYILGEYKLEEV